MSPASATASMTTDPLTEEVGVGVGTVALDDEVVPRRHQIEDDLGHQLTHQDVVEADVEGVGVLDEAVIRDHRDSLIGRGLNRGRIARVF